MVFAVILAAAGLARAAPSAAERETARRLMDEGKARLKANEAERAVEAFQKAHDIMHVPTTGMALARAHLAAGQLVEARDAALEVGRLPREAGDPAVFEAARKQARELDAQLKPRIPTVRIVIDGATPEKVTVDDVEIASSIVGEPVAVNPGKRVVAAHGAGGAEAKGEIELAERDAKEIRLTLPAPGKAKAAAGPSPSASGGVRGFGNDDDRGAGERTPLAYGLLYGGFGLGVAGLAAGGVTGAMTLSKASDLEPQCERGICDPSARGDLDSASSLASVSTIAFIAGGVGVAAGVIGLLLPRRPAGAKGRASITFGPVGAGVGARF